MESSEGKRGHTAAAAYVKDVRTLGNMLCNGEGVCEVAADNACLIAYCGKVHHLVLLKHNIAEIVKKIFFLALPKLGDAVFGKNLFGYFKKFLFFQSDFLSLFIVICFSAFFVLNIKVNKKHGNVCGAYARNS